MNMDWEERRGKVKDEDSDSEMRIFWWQEDGWMFKSELERQPYISTLGD
jgi:hypothetical protein